MFNNEFNDDNLPLCPICSKVIIPDNSLTSGAYLSKRGTWFAHHECVKGQFMLVLQPEL